MKTLGILKENNGDHRVSVIPNIVKQIRSNLGYAIAVETQAGISSGYSDEDYINAGAEVKSRKEVIEDASIILTIHHLDNCIETIKENTTIVSILNPLYHFPKLNPYLKKPLRVFSLDLLPRSTLAQSMDVLSSMASLAGYKAVVKAAETQTSVIPMFTTAAGTVKPARVLVLGAGVAGLQAIATAKRMGAIVDVFDVRSASAEEVRSLGANFIEVEGALEQLNSGGYAIEQSADYLAKQTEMIDKYVSNASIVIATANIPGKQAPKLIKAESVYKMVKGSVIVDLAAEQGGNCELTVNGQISDINGVKIIGNSNLAGEIPETASKLLSTNYFNFLKHLQKIEMAGILNDTIVQDCLVIDEGVLVNNRVKSYMY
jgi:NAD(P) transhydrogenase subunit alpha